MLTESLLHKAFFIFISFNYIVCICNCTYCKYNNVYCIYNKYYIFIFCVIYIASMAFIVHNS